MTTCDCTSTNLTIELVLKLDRFDFAPVLRKLLSAAGTVSVGGFQPLAVPGLASFALDHALLGAWPYVAEMLSIYDLAVTAESYVGTSTERTTGTTYGYIYEKDLALNVAKPLKTARQGLDTVESGFLPRDKDLDDKVRPQLIWRTNFAHEKKAETISSSSSSSYTLVAGRNPRVKTKHLSVTREFDGEASALIELGFLSNAADRQTIMDEPAKVAAQIAAGISDYIRENPRE